jgi:uncharacterized protein YdhG (YjbR/CyaY superfamily)
MLLDVGAMLNKTEYRSVDEYIAAQPATAQSALKCVREAIRESVPDAEESISYNMPAYKLSGKPLLHFAGWNGYYSLYLATAPVVAAFQSELAPYKVIRGTIRFPLSKPVPTELIERIARFRKSELTEQVRLP